MGKVNAMYMEQMERDREELDRLWRQFLKYDGEASLLRCEYDKAADKFYAKYGEEP